MIITAEISLYPLREDFVSEIRRFILDLRGQDGIQVLSNQLSTQVRGEFDAVMPAMNRCLRRSMERAGTAVFVVKYVNADLDIGSAPHIERAD